MSIKLKHAIQTINQAKILCGSVSTLALLAMTTAVNTHAQDSQVIEEVTVTAIRGAFRDALNSKRDANAVVDSISSEDIGKFPDKNIAESLQRISGVSINRGFTGEGNEVSIRGVNPELTQVLLNGQYVASTGWFSQQANKRSFNMDMLPSEMVANVEVYKSPVASQDEGGVGGTVIVHTRKPLDLEPFTLFASMDANQNSIDTDDTGIGGSVMVSWKNDDDTFGILASISKTETIGRAHKAENYWEESWSASGISEFNQNRERDSVDITAQFRPIENLTLTGHYFLSDLNAKNTNQNFLVINSNSDDGVDTTFSSSGGRTAPNGLPTIGTINGGAAFLAQDTNSREAKLDSQVIDFNVDFIGEGYQINGTLGTTKATGGDGGNANGLWGVSGYNNGPVAFPNGSTIDINMDGNKKIMLRPNGYDLADASWQALQDGDVTKTNLTDKETYAQVDFNLDVNWGLINSLQTGLKLRQHEFSNAVTNYSFTGDMTGVTIAQFSNGLVNHSGEGLINSPTKFVRLDADAYAAWLKSNVTATNQGTRFVNGFDRQAWGKVEEDINAAYVQTDFEGQGFRGNMGMRYVETDLNGYSYNFTQTAIEKQSHHYSDWLPSLNIAMDLSENVILRASAARVISRPGYSQLTPSFTNINTRTLQATKGDIRLDPFRAAQTDFGVEWYFAEEALASAAIFSKDIRSFITQSLSTITQLDENGVPASYTLSTPTQGRGGKLQGVELQYQQNFNNFGVVANYTYVDGQGENENGVSVDLPGTSRNAYNLTSYYENHHMSVRLAYTYRDAFLAEGLGVGGSSKFAAQDFLDASVVWHINEQFDVSVEGVNLLGEVTRELHAGSLETLRMSTDNGTRFFLKASYRMN